MEQCQTLNEYAQYVEKVRTYTKEDNLDNAVERAVNECIHDGILADFLTQNKSEVIAMSIFEYDEKAVRQVYYEDGLQAGRKDGIKTGILNMLKTQKYSLEEISEVFQVPVEEIEQIKKQQIYHERFLKKETNFCKICLFFQNILIARRKIWSQCSRHITDRHRLKPNASRSRNHCIKQSLSSKYDIF